MRSQGEAQGGDGGSREGAACCSVRPGTAKHSDGSIRELRRPVGGGRQWLAATGREGHHGAAVPELGLPARPTSVAWGVEVVIAVIS